jgi:hypothetical protein
MCVVPRCASLLTYSSLTLSLLTAAAAGDATLCAATACAAVTGSLLLWFEQFWGMNLGESLLHYTALTLYNVIQSALRRHCVVTAMTSQTLIYTV